MSKGKRWKLYFAFAVLLLIALVVFAWWYAFSMPGQSYSGPVDQESAVAKSSDAKSESPSSEPGPPASLAEELESLVVHFAETIGERNLGHYQPLNDAADYIEGCFRRHDLVTSRQEFDVHGLECFNIIGEFPGTTQTDEIVIVGAHYDSVSGTPGANDNGSGTAAMLVLVKRLIGKKHDRTIRFVGFTNEEPPYFQNEGQMGSWVYAQQCRRNGDNIVAVVSLETMGYFTDELESQKYPRPLDLMYPSTGNFIGFVSNLGSRPLLRRALKTFREHAQVPSEGASLPGEMPGVGWSDHWSFWQEGYQGIMVTDTAPFRYPHYHRDTDTPDKLDYERFAKVVEALVPVIEELATVDVPKKSE